MTDKSNVINLVIAVDGPAASGKGTLSRRIAAHYDLHYLDTGSLYRAVALKAIEGSVDLTDIEGLTPIAKSLKLEGISDEALRAPGIGDAASKIAGIKELRAALLDFQRSFATRAPGAVLDGRDIGTVVCPSADVKLFITASVEERARRRYRELNAKNQDIKFEDVLADIVKRDQRDLDRAAAPLLQAADAYLLDTTNLDIEAAMDAAVQFVDQAIAAKN